MRRQPLFPSGLPAHEGSSATTPKPFPALLGEPLHANTSPQLPSGPWYFPFARAFLSCSLEKAPWSPPGQRAAKDQGWETTVWDTSAWVTSPDARLPVCGQEGGCQQHARPGPGQHESILAHSFIWIRRSATSLLEGQPAAGLAFAGMEG